MVLRTGRLCLNRKFVPEQGNLAEQDRSLNRKAISKQDDRLNRRKTASEQGDLSEQDGCLIRKVVSEQESFL
jgi:hypothetical protein